MLQLRQQLNKIVEMLAIQRKKSSLTQPQVSLFDDSCLNYELFQTAQFRVPCFASHTWSRIQCTSSNPATNLRVIRQFHSFFFSLLEFWTFMLVNFCLNLSTSIRWSFDTRRQLRRVQILLSALLFEKTTQSCQFFILNRNELEKREKWEYKWHVQKFQFALTCYTNHKFTQAPTYALL